MSWSITAEVSRENALADLTARARSYDVRDAGEQPSRCILAAVDLIEAGAVSDVNRLDDPRYLVSLAGASDLVTVSVARL